MRAPSRAELGIPLHRVSFAEQYRAARVRLFPHRVSRGPHPQPGRALQSRDQVRHLPRLRRAARARSGLPPATTRDFATAPRAPNCSRPRIPTRTSPTFCTPSAREHFARVLFPLGELTKSDVRAHRARGRSAGVRQAGLHRHLLHRRTTVPRIPRALHPHVPGRHRHRNRRNRRASSRPGVLHAGSARRSRDRRPRRRTTNDPGTWRPRISRAMNSSPCRATIIRCSSAVR